ASLGDRRSRTPLSHPSTRIRTDVRSHDLASLNTLRTRRTVRTPIRTWVRVGTTRNRLAERGRRWIDGGGNPGDGSRAGEARGPRGAPGPRSDSSVTPLHQDSHRRSKS